MTSISHGVMSRLFPLVLLLMASAGCELAQGIFKAGMWVGIIVVLAVIALLVMVFRRLGG